MDRWQDFERLVGEARSDVPAPVDVTQQVLARIDVSRGPTHARGTIGAAARLRGLATDEARLQQRPLLVCAAGALLAASVTAALAAHWWIVLDDPLVSMLRGLELMNP